MHAGSKRILLSIAMLVCAVRCAVASVSESIDQALSVQCLRHCQEGVLIRSLDSGRTVYEKNSSLLLVPASNFKLVVGGSALDIFGPEYRMKTCLYYTGKIDSGVLKGDLILVGGGDPVLSLDQLRMMADKVKALGIRRIEGKVIGDSGWFDDERLGDGWEWDSEAYYYAAQVSALNLNENSVDVFVRPGDRVGSMASVSVVPATGYVAVRNECTTSRAGSAKTVVVDRLEAQNVIRVTGTVPLDYRNPKAEESISIDDPARFACCVLEEMFRGGGVQISESGSAATSPAEKYAKGGVRQEPYPPGALHRFDTDERRLSSARSAVPGVLVAEVDSPPLSKMLALLNKPSDNLIAECLLKTLGKQAGGEGSTAAGIKVETGFLKRIGADTSGVGITDGSGLSRKNCISPDNLVKILTYMYHHKQANVFLDSLPIAGVDGTLRNRMKATPAQGNVRAKTGSLTHVSCLSGFVKTRGGENLVFSIMLNNFLCSRQEATAAQDRIVEVLADSR